MYYIWQFLPKILMLPLPHIWFPHKSSWVLLFSFVSSLAEGTPVVFFEFLHSFTVFSFLVVPDILLMGSYVICMMVPPWYITIILRWVLILFIFFYISVMWIQIASIYLYSDLSTPLQLHGFQLVLFWGIVLFFIFFVIN